jgi:hypothetical protein
LDIISSKVGDAAEKRNVRSKRSNTSNVTNGKEIDCLNSFEVAAYISCARLRRGVRKKN